LSTWGDWSIQAFVVPELDCGTFLNVVRGIMIAPR